VGLWDYEIMGLWDCRIMGLWWDCSRIAEGLKGIEREKREKKKREKWREKGERRKGEKEETQTNIPSSYSRSSST